jgi:hypothetical protein
MQEQDPKLLVWARFVWGACASIPLGTRTHIIQRSASSSDIFLRWTSFTKSGLGGTGPEPDALGNMYVDLHLSSEINTDAPNKLYINKVKLLYDTYGRVYVRVSGVCRGCRLVLCHHCSSHFLV